MRLNDDGTWGDELKKSEVGEEDGGSSGRYLYSRKRHLDEDPPMA